MMYLIIFIGFLVVFTLVNKYNQSTINSITQNAQANSQMPKLAELLSLQYQKLDQPQNSSTITSMGEKISGTYQSVPIEIIMGMQAEHSKEINIGYRSAYQYNIQKTITLQVKNPDNKAFHLFPKDQNTKGQATGNQDFDEKFTLTGENLLTPQLTDYLLSLGWIDLKLKGDKLTFTDNFFDQFSKPGFAGTKMLSAVHPIWKSSAQNTQIDLHNVKNFIDQLIEFIKETKLI